MTDYFETMGIPIVAGPGFLPSDAASGPVVIVNETMVNTFWKDRESDRPDAASRASRRSRRCRDFTVIGVAKDVKQGGVDKKTGTELYFLIDQTAIAAARRSPTRRAR